MRCEHERRAGVWVSHSGAAHGPHATLPPRRRDADGIEQAARTWPAAAGVALCTREAAGRHVTPRRTGQAVANTTQPRCWRRAWCVTWRARNVGLGMSIVRSRSTATIIGGGVGWNRVPRGYHLAASASSGAGLGNVSSIDRVALDSRRCGDVALRSQGSAWTSPTAVTWHCGRGGRPGCPPWTVRTMSGGCGEGRGAVVRGDGGLGGVDNRRGWSAGPC